MGKDEEEEEDCALYSICATASDTISYGTIKLTISVWQASAPAQRTMTLEDDRPPDRHASSDRNVKFLNLFNTNFSAMWSHVLYIAFEGNDSAIQWCQFCVSLSGRLFNILQLFASFSQNQKLLQWRSV